MEGLLHPVGPEEARTYWIRRAGALAVLIVLMVGVGSMISNIGGGDAPLAAEPAPAGNVETPAPAEPTGEAAAGPSEKVVEEEAVPVPSGSEATKKPAPESPAPTEPQPSKPAPETAAPSQSAPPAEQPLPPEPANTFHRTEQATRSTNDRAPAPCNPQTMQVTLDGPKQVKKGEPVTYRIAANNNSDNDCALQIHEQTFELKIYSGVDRIWSSRDCAAGLPPRGAVLAPGHSMDWAMEWRVERSAAQCRTSEEPIGSGTYIATAQLTGGKPVQLVMQLKA